MSHDDTSLPPGQWVSRPRWEDAVYAQMSTPTGKAVVLRLARHMKWGDGRPGRDGEPGNARLAAEVGVSERQVQRCLEEARSLGLIEMTRRHNNRRSGHPQAAYTAQMPSVPALPMPVDTSPARTPPPDISVRSSEAAPEPHHRTPVSGGGADHRTPVSGSTHVKNLRELLPPDPPLTQATIMVGVPGSSGSSNNDQKMGSVADVDAVLDALAATLPVSSGDRAALAGDLRGALDTDGWDTATLAAHLLAELPAVIRTRGLMKHRLSPTVLPDSPAVCSCSACRRHVRQAEAEIRRQTAELDRARQRKAVQADDAGRRQDEITEALGSVLHGRIVAAELARLAQPAPGVKNPGVAPGTAARAMTASLARSPARIRALVAGVYLEHHYELDAVRAYAESLPAGPTETATTDGDSPTGTDEPIVRLRRAQGA